MASRSTGVRRTLIAFATFTGLLLSMAQSCDTACGSNEASSASAPRATVRPAGDDSSGARYFQERQKGYDGTGTTTTRSRSTATAVPGECTSTGGTTTRTRTKTPTTKTKDKDDGGKSGNNGSAFDDGYDKGYDEGYDDARRDHSGSDSGKDSGGDSGKDSGDDG